MIQYIIHSEIAYGTNYNWYEFRKKWTKNEMVKVVLVSMYFENESSVNRPNLLHTMYNITLLIFKESKVNQNNQKYNSIVQTNI